MKFKINYFFFISFITNNVLANESISNLIGQLNSPSVYQDLTTAGNPLINKIEQALLTASKNNTINTDASIKNLITTLKIKIKTLQNDPSIEDDPYKAVSLIKLNAITQNKELTQYFPEEKQSWAEWFKEKGKSIAQYITKKTIDSGRDINNYLLPKIQESFTSRPLGTDILDQFSLKGTIKALWNVRSGKASEAEKVIFSAFRGGLDFLNSLNGLFQEQSKRKLSPKESLSMDYITHFIVYGAEETKNLINNDVFTYINSNGKVLLQNYIDNYIKEKVIIYKEELKKQSNIKNPEKLINKYQKSLTENIDRASRFLTGKLKWWEKCLFSLITKIGNKIVPKEKIEQETGQLMTKEALKIGADVIASVFSDVQDATKVMVIDGITFTKNTVISAKNVMVNKANELKEQAGKIAKTIQWVIQNPTEILTYIGGFAGKLLQELQDPSQLSEYTTGSTEQNTEKPDEQFYDAIAQNKDTLRNILSDEQIEELYNLPLEQFAQAMEAIVNQFKEQLRSKFSQGTIEIFVNMMNNSINNEIYLSADPADFDKLTREIQQEIIKAWSNASEADLKDINIDDFPETLQEVIRKNPNWEDDVFYDARENQIDDFSITQLIQEYQNPTSDYPQDKLESTLLQKLKTATAQDFANLPSIDTLPENLKNSITEALLKLPKTNGSYTATYKNLSLPALEIIQEKGNDDQIDTATFAEIQKSKITPLEQLEFINLNSSSIESDFYNIYFQHISQNIDILKDNNQAFTELVNAKIQKLPDAEKIKVIKEITLLLSNQINSLAISRTSPSVRFNYISTKLRLLKDGYKALASEFITKYPKPFIQAAQSFDELQNIIDILSENPEYKDKLPDLLIQNSNTFDQLQNVIDILSHGPNYTEAIKTDLRTKLTKIYNAGQPDLATATKQEKLNWLNTYNSLKKDIETPLSTEKPSSGLFESKSIQNLFADIVNNTKYSEKEKAQKLADILVKNATGDIIYKPETGRVYAGKSNINFNLNLIRNENSYSSLVTTLEEELEGRIALSTDKENQLIDGIKQALKDGAAEMPKDPGVLQRIGNNLKSLWSTLKTTVNKWRGTKTETKTSPDIISNLLGTGRTEETGPNQAELLQKSGEKTKELEAEEAAEKARQAALLRQQAIADPEKLKPKNPKQKQNNKVNPQETPKPTADPNTHQSGNDDYEFGTEEPPLGEIHKVSEPGDTVNGNEGGNDSGIEE